MPPGDRFIPPSALDPVDEWEIRNLEAQADHYLRQQISQEVQDPWQVRLDLLPPDIRTNLNLQFQELYNIRDVFGKALEAGGIDWVGSDYGVLPIRVVRDDGTVDPLALYHRLHYVQRKETSSSDIFDSMTTSARRYRYSAVQQMAEEMTGILQNPPTGRVVVLDTETGGLGERAGIWQFSARVFENGEELQDQAVNMYFRNPMMERGVIGGQKISDWLANKRGFEYGEFADALPQIHQLLSGADVIAGHNLAFDIGKIREGAVRTKGYTSNRPDMVNFVDFLSTLPQQKNVVDTRILAMALLDRPSIAPEFARMGDNKPFSLANIMLQTNFMERLMHDTSEEAVMQHLKDASGHGQLHWADIDTWFEGHLYRYLTDKDNPLQNVPLARTDIRNLITRSSAITPYTNIHSVEDLDPNVKSMLETSGLIHVDPETGEVSRIEMTPLAQEILMSRQTSLANSEFRHGGSIRRMMHEYSTTGGSMQPGRLRLDVPIPTLSSWASIQEELKEAGIPFANLSFYERYLTSLLGRVSSKREIFNAYGSELGMARMTSSYYASASRSGKPIIPREVLEAAEKAGVLQSSFLKGEQVLELSPFTFLRKRGDLEQRMHDVGLIYRLKDQDEAERLISYIRSTEGRAALSSYRAFDVDRLAESILTEGMHSGISVGTLGGVNYKGADYRERADINRIYWALRDLQGGEEDITDQRARFATVYRGDEHLAGVFLNQGPLESVIAASKHASAVFDQVRGYDPDKVSRDATMERLARAMNDSDAEAAKWASKVDAFYSKTHEKLPYAVAGSLLAGASYYLHRKHEKNKEYNDAMAAMPYQSSNETQRQIKQVRRQRLNARHARQMNPMATANTVSNMNNMRIGHTQMGPEKYNYLFGGYS